MLSLSICQKELLYASLLAAGALWISHMAHFFDLKERRSINPVSFLTMFGAFAVFASSYILVFPLVDLLIFRRTLEISGFISLFAFGVGSLLLLLYLGKSDPSVKTAVIAPTSRKASAYYYGAISWLVAYPVSLFFGKIAACVMEGLFNYKDAMQSIAKQIFYLRPYPLLFSFTAFAVVILVPAVEELLFRGFLQNYLKNKMPRTAAIFLTAFLFTMAHFSFAQGLGNIEILTSLFVLSLFLSYIYEKWGNILAPIALHQTFNCISFVALFVLPPEGLF